MNYNEAVKYCEDHECTECPVYNLDLDKRTLEEKRNLHVPCCKNLVNDETVDRFIRLKNRDALNKLIKEIEEKCKTLTYNFDELPKNFTMYSQDGKVKFTIDISIVDEKK